MPISDVSSMVGIRSKNLVINLAKSSSEMEMTNFIVPVPVNQALFWGERHTVEDRELPDDFF